MQTIEMAPDAKWYFLVRCANCHEMHENEVYVELDQSVSGKFQKRGKNLVLTCKFCRREASLDVVHGSVMPYRSSEAFQPMAQFECRGLEIVQWLIRDGVIVTSDSGTVFPDQDLSTRDWSDFDSESQSAISVFDISTRVSR